VGSFTLRLTTPRRKGNGKIFDSRWLDDDHHLIALTMEAARTSETLVIFYQTTRRYNPEDSHLRTHRRENLKSYVLEFISNLLPMFIHPYLSMSITIYRIIKKALCSSY
jgi:hypothetical protein